MAIQPTVKKKRRPKNPCNRLFERAMAIVALVNLGLVMFDLTYVSWRNFWLQGNVVIPFVGKQIPILPGTNYSCPDSSQRSNEAPRLVQKSLITCLYDPIKGIELNRDTEYYLRLVRRLEQRIGEAGTQTGLKSPEVAATLKELRQLSIDMVASNPFEAVGKSGTLERIKNQVRDRVHAKTGQELSATKAFELFWSEGYLAKQGFQSEVGSFNTQGNLFSRDGWFNQTIAPLIATNYYRTIGENGEFTDNFWLLDAPFVILFFLEFLARTYYLSGRYTNLNWLDAMLWRWYDIPLFIPFSLFFPPLALTRVLPTVLRLNTAGMIDLDQINTQMRQGFVASIAEEMTELVIVQVINQVQGSIRRGEVMQWLQSTSNRRYIDINNVNEIELISKQLLELVLYRVFPKVQPDLEALLSHSVMSVLKQSPAYQGLQALPGITNLPQQITDRVVATLTQTVYESVKTSLEDPELAKLTARLVQNFSTTMMSEAQNQNNLQEIQTLLTDLLEEIKINYVQRLAEEDVALLLDQTRHLQHLPKPD